MRPSKLKITLATAFGAAADAYHGGADVQREVAARLARRIGTLNLASPRVLEIGCGTGFLYQALAPNLPGASWLLTDLSAAMVERARSEIGDHVHFAVMDGEHPTFMDDRFDLICASLVFQWFEDLPGSLRKLTGLLNPGGVLAFSTLAAESFPEWHEAHRALGIQAATRVYPTIDEIAGMAPPGTRIAVDVEEIPRAYPNAHAFLTHWKEIGTHVADTDRAPLTPGVMRKLLRRFEDGVTVTYHVAYGSILKT